jgi:hypothetical protein
VSAASALGFALGVIGAALPLLARVGVGGVAALVALAYAVGEVRDRPLPVPQRRWQVPQEWALHGRAVWAAEFGAILGLGFLTYVPFAGYYVLVLGCASLGDPWAAMVAMGTYGLARALPVVYASTRMADPSAMNWATQLPTRLPRLYRATRWLRVVSLLAAAAALAALRP